MNVTSNGLRLNPVSTNSLDIDQTVKLKTGQPFLIDFNNGVAIRATVRRIRKLRNGNHRVYFVVSPTKPPLQQPSFFFCSFLVFQHAYEFATLG